MELTLNRIAENAKNLSGYNRKVAESFISYLSFLTTEPEYLGNPPKQLLESFSSSHEGFEIENMFCGIMEALKALVGQNHAAVLTRLCDRSCEYVYSNPSSDLFKKSLSFRTSKYSGLYYYHNIDLIASYICAHTDGFTFQKYIEEQNRGFDSKVFMRENVFIPYYLGYLIDEGSDTIACLGSVKNSINKRMKISSNFGFARIKNLIHGLLCSHSNDAHMFVSSLISDIKLSEDHREAILACVHQGTLDSFSHILSNIPSTKASVQKYFFEWTGLNTDYILGEYAAFSFKYAAEYISDDASRIKWLGDDDPFRYYLALWATGERSLEQLESYCLSIPESLPPWKVWIIIFYLGKINNVTLSLELMIHLRKKFSCASVSVGRILSVHCLSRISEPTTKIEFIHADDVIPMFDCSCLSIVNKERDALINFLHDIRTELHDKNIDGIGNFFWLGGKICVAVCMEQIEEIIYILQNPNSAYYSDERVRLRLRQTAIL